MSCTASRPAASCLTRHGCFSAPVPTSRNAKTRSGASTAIRPAPPWAEPAGLRQSAQRVRTGHQAPASRRTRRTGIFAIDQRADRLGPRWRHHPAQVAGLVDPARGVLTGIDRLASPPAAVDLHLQAVEARLKLLPAVERGYHHMPSLPALRVIAVVTDDEALDAVIFGVHVRHSSTVTTAIRSNHLQLS
jgi:hypothetical protein